jgi:hypothetical protein
MYSTSPSSPPSQICVTWARLYVGVYVEMGKEGRWVCEIDRRWTMVCLNLYHKDRQVAIYRHLLDWWFGIIGCVIYPFHLSLHARQVWAAMYKDALHDLSYWQRHPAEEPADFDDVRSSVLSSLDLLLHPLFIFWRPASYQLNFQCISWSEACATHQIRLCSWEVSERVVSLHVSFHVYMPSEYTIRECLSENAESERCSAGRRRGRARLHQGGDVSLLTTYILYLIYI